MKMSSSVSSIDSSVNVAVGHPAGTSNDCGNFAAKSEEGKVSKDALEGKVAAATMPKKSTVGNEKRVMKKTSSIDVNAAEIPSGKVPSVAVVPSKKKGTNYTQRMGMGNKKKEAKKWNHAVKRSDEHVSSDRCQLFCYIVSSLSNIISLLSAMTEKATK